MNIYKFKNIIIFLFLNIIIFLFLNIKKVQCKGLTEEIFFVGEDVRVLTIASRRPESPKEAPAIAAVLTAEDLRHMGVRTLAEALSYLPGFYVGQREWGSLPYLRGVPEGILFLYDGVPLTSDSTKAIHPLDEELSLEAVERIEVIRGPGSVLWGPDAFVGIVNIVPRSGAKYSGFEAGTLLGGPFKDHKIFLNYGKATSFGEFFCSFSSYFRKPYITNYHLPWKEGLIGNAEFYETVGNLRLWRFLRFSWRWSNFRRPFVKAMWDGPTWPGLFKSPVSFFRIESEKRFGSRSIRFNGYYTYLYQHHEELSLITQQKNHLLYGEILYEQELWGKKALFTIGASWRRNIVRDATVNVRGFLPEYINAENSDLWPLQDIADFDTDLRSVFFQYRHHYHHLEFWGGLRLDDHDQYKSTLSYNLGIGWFLKKDFYLKMLTGTAYRTPYSVQFLRWKSPPEEIKNFSVELFWQPISSFSFRVSPFYNHIKHHVAEDPFGGFSSPTEQKFIGLETSAKWQPVERFKIWANFTLFSHWGDKEVYRVLDYFIITPEGKIRTVYSNYKKNFDLGAKKIANLGIDWLISKKTDLFLHFSYVGQRKLELLREEKQKSFGPVLQADFSLRHKLSYPLGASGPKKVELQLAIKNLWHTRYYIPGSLASLPGQPWTAYFTLCFTW